MAAVKDYCIRQHERQLHAQFILYNYNTLTALRTSVRESPACIKSFLVQLAFNTVN